MIRAIIFDMDELMVDSTENLYEAFREVLIEYGVKSPEIDTGTENKLRGMRIKEIAQLLLEKFGVKADLDEFLAKRNKIFMNLMELKTKPMPGLFELIKRVKGKYRLALCSSGVREYIDLILRKLGLNNGLFEVIVSGESVRKGKPDPEPYIVTTKRLHLPPRMCVVIEDAKKGVESAKAAGCRCIGVQNPHPQYRQDLSEADLSGADLSGADLSGADLGRAILCDCDFRAAIVTFREKLVRVQFEEVADATA